jgi:hypothetical protein
MCDVGKTAEQPVVAVEIAAEQRTIAAHSASYGEGRKRHEKIPPLSPLPGLGRF